MRLALSSRERAVRYLQRINDLHALQTNGTCMCRARPRCRVAEMLAERWPQEMIRRLDDADARGDDEWDE
jgi:hypothetical protein